jgi:hypothetical protein
VGCQSGVSSAAVGRVHTGRAHAPQARGPPPGSRRPVSPEPELAAGTSAVQHPPARVLLRQRDKAAAHSDRARVVRASPLSDVRKRGAALGVGVLAVRLPPPGSLRLRHRGPNTAGAPAPIIRHSPGPGPTVPAELSGCGPGVPRTPRPRLADPARRGWCRWGAPRAVGAAPLDPQTPHGQPGPLIAAELAALAKCVAARPAAPPGFDLRSGDDLLILPVLWAAASRAPVSWCTRRPHRLRTRPPRPRGTSRSTA